MIKFEAVFKSVLKFSFKKSFILPDLSDFHGIINTVTAIFFNAVIILIECCSKSGTKCDWKIVSFFWPKHRRDYATG